MLSLEAALAIYNDPADLLENYDTSPLGQGSELLSGRWVNRRLPARSPATAPGRAGRTVPGRPPSSRASSS